MLELLTLFAPFFALVVLGWGAARSRLLPLEGIGAMTVFVLFFGLPAMLFRVGASGALHQPDLLALLLVYGAAGAVVLGATLWWAARQGWSRRDGGLVGLVTTFPNTGFLGLPLLTGLLGPSSAGPLAATLVIDVLLFSSLSLAWAHSQRRDQPEAGAWQAAKASWMGALRNPLLWSMLVGMVVGEAQWALPSVLASTLDMLGRSATPVALFTLGAILARAQMQAVEPGVSEVGLARLWWPATLKLVAHPALVLGLGLACQSVGVQVSQAGLVTLVMAAALPSASNVSMLAEREGANVTRVAQVILLTTAVALVSLTCWAHGLGVRASLS
jgi:malonate transporter and related proteins